MGLMRNKNLEEEYSKVLNELGFNINTEIESKPEQEEEEEKKQKENKK